MKKEPKPSYSTIEINGSDYKTLKYNVVGSTNNMMKQKIVENNAENKTVILSGFQEKGKGQGQNIWHSSRGKNMLLSIYYTPMPMKVENHFVISEWISVAIVEFLKELGLKASVKWPNDIYFENKKLAGILIENRLMGPSIKSTIIGIGLNVNEVDFPNDLPNPISLKQITSKEYNVDALVPNLLKRIDLYLPMLANKTTVCRIHSMYNALLYRRNKQTKFLLNGKEEIKAKIIGTETSGELLVETLHGVRKAYDFEQLKMVLGN